jgi:UDP-glucuronate decarboxylase
MGETLMYQYKRQCDTDIRVARIFNTYGPRMLKQDGRVVSNFVWQALTGQPLTVYGDGSQTRSFCYVSDTVQALILLMKSNYIGPVNIGNPLECTISELANLISALLEKELPAIQLPLPSDDPTRRCPNIAIAARELNWWPKVKIEAGLAEMIKDFKSRL